jgi:hypothetical protein
MIDLDLCIFRTKLDKATTVSFSDEEDTLIWHFSSNAIYSSQLLSKIINFREIITVYGHLSSPGPSAHRAHS